MNLVFVWVVYGVDIGVFDVLNSGVELYLVGMFVIVVSEYLCVFDFFILFWVVFDIVNDGYD